MRLTLGIRRCQQKIAGSAAQLATVRVDLCPGNALQRTVCILDRQNCDRAVLSFCGAVTTHTRTKARRRFTTVEIGAEPLLETAGYEPTAGGMRVARAHVTTFASVTDAPSLARLSRLVRVRS